MPWSDGAFDLDPKSRTALLASALSGRGPQTLATPRQKALALALEQRAAITTNLAATNFYTPDKQFPSATGISPPMEGGSSVAGQIGGQFSGSIRGQDGGASAYPGNSREIPDFTVQSQNDAALDLMSGQLGRPAFDEASWPIRADPSAFAIDRAALASQGREGPRKLQGYVPQYEGAPNARSGVTVGTGVDLRQKSPQQLQRWDIDGDTIRELTPYMRPQLMGAAADAFLKRQPLTITRAQAQALDDGAYREFATQVAQDYNNANPGVNNFSQLPPEVQTAMFDRAYARGFRNYRNDAVRQLFNRNDWISALRILETSGPRARTSASSLAPVFAPPVPEPDVSQLPEFDFEQR